MVQNLTPRQLFLIDGIGAIVTALLLSQVLARWQPLFGMPREILYVLAAIAGGFAVYSLLCHLRLTDRWKPYLRAIAIANTLYCLVTLGLVVYLRASLTWLGIAYFIGEIAVVMTLVSVEMRTAKRLTD